MSSLVRSTAATTYNQNSNDDGMPLRRSFHHQLALLALGITWIQGLQQPTSLSSSLSAFPAVKVRNLPVHRVPLRQNSASNEATPLSPYSFAVSSIIDLPSSSNFLATQVWPSARVAARALEEYGPLLMKDSKIAMTFKVCELGCGPGLPSLTAAATMANCQVIATDIDVMALDLVTAAAIEQNLSDSVMTRTYDLIQADWDHEWMNTVDLFVMSDVFESSAIALGAARLTKHVLNGDSDARVWVFAQSDRAQREVYLSELQRLFPDDSKIRAGWTAFDSYHADNRLWLCNLEETAVNYT